jgi:hypothetical protein
MNNDKSTIESYRVFVKFDYNGLISPDLHYFTKDISHMSDKMSNIVSKYVLNSKGKLIQGGENTSISEGDIWTLDFAADDRHIFDMSYQIVPNQED